ncbi:MAG: S8 family peptidase [Actinomycetota bacterium]|nr:S8 family peptidase [Actinomycetota bacterium]
MARRLSRLCLVLLLLSTGAVLPSTTAAAAAHPVTAGPVTAAPARVDPVLPTSGDEDVRIVVRHARGAGDAAAGAVLRAGGQLSRHLPIVSGFAATLPAAAVPALAAADGVQVISADRAVRVSGGPSEGGGGPLAPRVVKAPSAWTEGATGAGVTVALVDTGVADVPDLTGRIVPVQDNLTGRTADCYDLSGEGHCGDSYGHGTFMAGLIAGDGTAAGGVPTGTAPEARVLSVKIAGADGAADVSTVLAAIQWVVSFRDRYDVRVLNLSLGTDSTQPWQDDPLNYAVERAWDAGILVVVAAANTGPAAGTIAKPADDPWVLTVGAIDDRGTPGAGDDHSPDFSARGPTAHGVAKPDVVAPGAHVLSLRAPRSTLDRDFPTQDTTSPYRTGSGTSMAAAVVSGAAAVALQVNPTMTPDQLKHALRAGSRPVASGDASVVGAGLIDAYATALQPQSGAANTGLPRSTGRGDLGTSRGSLLLQADDPLGTVLTGRQTAQLLLWDPLGFTSGSWTPQTWYSSAHALAGWNTATWVDSGTGVLSLSGHNWTGHNWTGHNWTGSSWYGQSESSSAYGRPGAGSASYGAWD